MKIYLRKKTLVGHYDEEGRPSAEYIAETTILSNQVRGKGSTPHEAVRALADQLKVVWEKGLSNTDGPGDDDDNVNVNSFLFGDKETKKKSRR